MPYPIGSKSPSLLRTWGEQIGKGRRLLLLFVSCLYAGEETLIFLALDWGSHYSHLVLRPLHSDWNYITSLSGLQLAKGKSRDLAIMITWANTSFLISIYLSPIGSVSLENPNKNVNQCESIKDKAKGERE